jgi:hypothetical protein
MIIVLRPPTRLNHILGKRRFPGRPQSCPTIYWLEKATKDFDQISTPDRTAENGMQVKVQ